MAPDRHPEFPNFTEIKSAPPKNGPLARVIEISSRRRRYQVIPDTDDLAAELRLMQPPQMEGEWEFDGNLFMHDRLMMGHRTWPSIYDREQSGTVSRHPMALEANNRLAGKLFDATSSLGRFITLRATRRSEEMSDEDITGIADFNDSKDGEVPPSAA